ncbi:MAG TPA: response regulator transcription factor [Bacillota bacterium]|nr:response regulator transcription factor [Bacillota bacterium]
MKKIMIMIVEDDQEWLKAMTSFLNNETDFYVAKAVSSREEALQTINDSDQPIDIILMDINLTEDNLDGIYLTAQINQIRKVKIIMLTSLHNEKIIRDSFAAGAVNYIEKTNFKEIPSLIRSVHYHTSPVEILLQDYYRLRRMELLGALTAAEREIFELVESGMTQSQIEKKLYKSASTLKTQVSNILKKLGVSSSKEAVMKVRMMGIVK